MSLVTIEWLVVDDRRGLFAVDVDVDEMGEPVAARVADSDEAFSIDELMCQVGEYREYFRALATRYHKRLRDVAGVMEH